jgi:hypothetical protein
MTHRKPIRKPYKQIAIKQRFCALLWSLIERGDSRKMREQIGVTTGKSIGGLIIAVLISCAISASVCPEALAATMWSKTYGGPGDEMGVGDIVQTSDGGYAILGNTTSFGAGGSDFWLIKTDADGNMQWNKTYGGALDDCALSMCQTGDGGYALAGKTNSSGAGAHDFWLVKTDAAGNMLWNKTYGGTDSESAAAVVQTSDGGYAVVGNTRFGVSDGDAWLVKTDAVGNMLWNKTYGGTGLETVHILLQAGSGFAIAGYTNSYGAGGQDAWLVKTDANGNMQWNKTYGGANTEYAFSLVATPDGGYAMGGYSASFGGFNAYIVKTDASGTKQWEQTYSTGGFDIGLYLIRTTDGGYALAGWNYLNGQDFVLFKTDANGNMQWSKSYGGTGLDNCFLLLQATDGGYVLAGHTNSFDAGGTDIWVVKTDALGVVPENFTIGVMLILSAVAVIVGRRCFRRRPRFESCGLEKT